ncbi:glycoside hydrolase family 2 protein [Gracilibacillus salinarum]|uniref:Beta-galactosidase n=1 Tax=Gracilibacillus salinarum TaxID=2932255 RepID=A0ABY4GSF4_9BACI|nr:sugar-binding domain-containing protein [Gracilibacillus salinarum]UOQ87164.1 hypothetical protein MUN87_09895 [Gracilibacillus salinarum]
MLNLNGTWHFSLDPNDEQNWIEGIPEETIQVPGSIEEQGYGEATAHQPIGTWKKKREYEGVAWYVKEITIPEDVAGKDVILQLDGVRWITECWLDSQYLGKEDRLSTAQCYSVSHVLKPGEKQRLVVKLDNRMHLPMQESHIHSQHTSTYWGGITGGIQLIARPRQGIKDIAITSDINRHLVELNIALRHENRESLSMEAAIVDDQGKEVTSVSLQELPQEGRLQLEMAKDARKWSPEDPYLYTVEVSLFRDGHLYDKRAVSFGFREITIAKYQILLNDVPVFLTGYVDCCIFPQTGYPVWDIDHYRKQFAIVKSYGFNHVRLHGWTPPEVFWQAADEAGMLVQTELPHWSRQYNDPTKNAPESVHQFLKKELKSILHALKNHPSFVMLSMGNELISEEGHPQMNELVKMARECDNSRIYTDNTGFGNLPAQTREGDFFVPTLNWHPPYNIDHAATTDTTTDYAEVTRLEEKPLIAHEHGQFTMYVRPQEAEKYQGILQPYWLETINETLAAKGLDQQTEAFIEATGVHLVRALKENIEKARRTPNLSGIQLLDIRDFPGQGHATVGILDVFWDDKGLIEPEAFRQFNEPTVLLMRSKQRTYFSQEHLTIQLELSHFGIPCPTANVHWQLVDEEKVYEKGVEQLHDIAGDGIREVVTIKEAIIVDQAKKITLKAWTDCNGKQVSNQWDFWVYPKQNLPRHVERIWTNIDELRASLYGARFENELGVNELSFQPETEVDLAITDQLSRDVMQYVLDGGNLWLMAKEGGQYDEVITRYLPTFWNYLWFPEQVGTTMGMQIHSHPLLNRLPHDGFSDWQWYHLVDRTVALNLESIPKVQPLIEVVDNFNRAKKLAYMFEVRLGRGKIFVSTLNLTNRKQMKSPETQHAFFNIIDYLQSEDFQPDASITVGELLGLFKVKSLIKLTY